MVAFGFALSSEEHTPQELVRQSALAEQHGFSFALISDHYHPWTEHQGQSAFVWSALGAIAQVTSALQVGTGVTCPIIRMHPAILAQAAATTQMLFDGRFFLGVGSGEQLNEHVTGEPWPNAGTRLEMLEEAIELMRLLWRGREVSRIGKHFVTDEARIFSLPEQAPRVYVAVKGHRAIDLAGRIGDGLVGLAPDREITERFEAHGGAGKPRIAQVATCFAPTEGESRALVHEWWPNVGLKGRLSSELKTPEDIESAVEIPATVDSGMYDASCSATTPLDTSRRCRRWSMPGTTTCTCTTSASSKTHSWSSRSES